MRPANLILALLLALALAAGIWLALSVQDPSEELPEAAPEDVVTSTATVYPSAVELPQVSLVDQTGATVDQSFFEGQWDLVFFGFASCPDICPITLGVLTQAQRQLEQRGVSTLPLKSASSMKSSTPWTTRAPCWS